MNRSLRTAYAILGHRLAKVLRRCNVGIDLTHQLISGISWSVVGAGLVQGGSFVTSIILARLLGKAEFGQYGMVQSTVVMLSNLAGFGLGLTATRYLADLRAIDPGRAGRILGLCTLTGTVSGTLFALVVLTQARWLATALFKEPAMASALQVAATFVLFTVLASCQAGAFAGLNAFKALTQVSAVYSLILLVCAAVLTSANGLEGAAAALCLAALAQFAYGHWKLRRELRAAKIASDYRHALKEAAVLAHFSLPAAMSAVLGGLAIWFVNISLARQPGGFSQLAIVAAGTAIRTLVLFGPALVNRAVGPTLTSLRSTGAQYGRVHNLNVLILCVIAVSIAAVCTFAAGPLLGLYGESFVGGRSAVIAFLWAGVLEVLATTLYQRLFVHARMWWQLGVNVLWSAAFIGIALGAIGAGGAFMVATAYAGAWTVSAVSYGVLGRILDQKDKGLRTVTGLGRGLE